jgi:tetratricopeptide (TPR) repeat protein
MGAFVQVFSSGKIDFPDQSEAVLEIREADSQGTALRRQKTISEVLTEDREGLDIGTFSTAELKPGYYSAELSLIDGSGRKVLTARENFVVLSQAAPVIPWVYAKGNPAFPNARDVASVSTEYFLTRQYEKALPLAEQALKLKDDASTRLLLAKVLYALGRWRDSVDILKAAESPEFNREAAKVLAAGYAALKDWESALTYLEKLMAEATEPSVLNLAGECHLNLGRPDRAASLFQKSLQVDPNQPAVKALLERARAAIK